jgi:hypothetical protein
MSRIDDDLEEPENAYGDNLTVRGTSTCDGLCQPACDWCNSWHECPEACGGGDDCPYEMLAARGQP